MNRDLRRVRHGIGLLWILLAISVAPAAADPGPNWPCDSPYREGYSREAVWGGPLPGSPRADWKNEPDVKRVVDYAANPENSPRIGEKKIRQFATEIDPAAGERSEKLLMTFTGLVDEFSVLKGFLIEGVRDNTMHGKILQESVDGHRAKIAGLPADDSPETLAKKKGLQRAAETDARRLDDALEEAEFICRRYRYLDKKLNILTKVIRDSL